MGTTGEAEIGLGPGDVTVTEVALRDGLQDLPVWVPTADKAALVARIEAAGIHDIEVTSFVRPDRIPPLADADALSAVLRPAEHPGYSALVPNSRGLRRALEAGYRKVTVVASASEGHNRANLGAGLEDWLPGVERLIGEAGGAGVSVRAAISVAFGCPFEGVVPAARVVDMARRLADAGAGEVSLADTIGVARPAQVSDLVGMVTRAVGAPPSLHLHGGAGGAGRNVAAAVEAGVRHLDSALTGIGGCPYAPGAPGNIATEELVEILGPRCGLDASAVREAAAAVRAAVGAGVPLERQEQGA